MRTDRWTVCIALGAMLLWSCGDDENGGGGAGVGGACAQSVAGQPCGEDCFFAPAQVDCTAACQRIADLCAAGSCGTQCTSVNQDVQLCTLACQGTRGAYCTNETYGCWATESTCDGVGTCFGNAVARDVNVDGGSSAANGSESPGATAGSTRPSGGGGIDTSIGREPVSATDTSSPPPDGYCGRRGSAVAPRPEGDDSDRPGPTVSFRCPEDCLSKTAVILWGTDVYTDDSAVCISAIHAGVINNDTGGTVRLRWMPGQESYEGSEQNGVTSSSWGSWSNSFTFLR